MTEQPENPSEDMPPADSKPNTIQQRLNVKEWIDKHLYDKSTFTNRVDVQIPEDLEEGDKFALRCYAQALNYALLMNNSIIMALNNVEAKKYINAFNSIVQVTREALVTYVNLDEGNLAKLDIIVSEIFEYQFELLASDDLDEEEEYESKDLTELPFDASNITVTEILLISDVVHSLNNLAVFLPRALESAKNVDKSLEKISHEYREALREKFENLFQGYVLEQVSVHKVNEAIDKLDREVTSRIPDAIVNQVNNIDHDFPFSCTYLKVLLGNIGINSADAFNDFKNNNPNTDEKLEIDVQANKISNEAGESVIQITVTDNGIGVEDEIDISKITESGFKSKDGNGIGLKNLYHTLQKFNGTMRLLPREDEKRGAVVVIEIPINHDQVENL